MITYRRGTADDIPEITALLEAKGLFWPGAAATPYVAQDEDSGRIVGVYFTCVCMHAEPLVIEHGHGVSVTELSKVMRESVQQLSNELGEPIVVYANVQNNEKALGAAAKNGMEPIKDVVVHQITILPQEVQTEEHSNLVAAPPVM